MALARGAALDQLHPIFVPEVFSDDELDKDALVERLRRREPIVP